MAIIRNRDNVSQLLAGLTSFRNLSEQQRQRSVDRILSMPERFFGGLMTELTRLRNVRAQESAVSEAKKDRNLRLGIGTGAAVVGGAVAGPLVGISAGAGAALAGTGALAAGTLGTNPVPTVGQVGGLQPDQQSFNQFRDPTNFSTSGLLGAGQFAPTADDFEVRSLPLSLPSGAIELGKKPTTQKSIGPDEPVAFETKLEQALKRLREVGQQRLDEGDTESAVQIVQAILGFQQGLAA